MTVLRHYFISDDLDDLEALEEQLEEAGVDTPQIHVLSLDDQNVEGHIHLHEVNSFMKKDIVRSSLIGAAVGLLLSLSILAVSGWLGWTETKAGWIPFIFFGGNRFRLLYLGRWLVRHSNAKQEVCPIRGSA